MENLYAFRERPWDLARKLAGRALESLSEESPAYRVAKSAHQKVCVNYMRCLEFRAVAEKLDFKEGDNVLDISSPQWFTICLAYLFPKVNFLYTNIIVAEIEDFKCIAEVLNLDNIRYGILDIREPTIDRQFDHIYSISVMEHIYPEVGGDVLAYENVRGLLAPRGRFVVSVPYKESYNAIYVSGNVYERRDREGDAQFFGREYDKASYDALESEVNFKASDKKYIVEQKGLFSLDYYEWGKGSQSYLKYFVLVSTRVLRRLFGARFDGWVATRYYSLTDKVSERLINIVVVYDHKNLGV